MDEIFDLVSRSARQPDLEYAAAKVFIDKVLTSETRKRKKERRTSECFARMVANKIPDNIKQERNLLFKYFGIQTMARSYLIHDETPQDLYLRIATTLFTDPVDIENYYNALSLHKISNATPIMLNSGTGMQQLSSCFQLATSDDLGDLFDTVKSVGMISKWSGGISLFLHNIRAEGSIINSTGGACSGTKHYVQILNSTQKYVNQGGNRPGAVAVYLSVDHADILTFLGQSLLKGEAAFQQLSAPDLKYALWISDLFMEKLNEQLAAPNDPEAGTWHLFSPDTAPGLNLVYGQEYTDLYNRYVLEGRQVRTVKTKDIIDAAFRAWSQVGTPYVLFKDAINKKSNMKNVAPIQSSNLCCEITIPAWSKLDAAGYSKFNPDNAAGGETGVCNLAALCLESYFSPGAVFNWSELSDASGLLCRALNNVIDSSKYPNEECERSNRRHRPIGIGIMGLADVFARKKIAYDSPAAVDLATGIAAVIYYGALNASCQLAQKDGHYQSYPGSPASNGILQPDLWGEVDWETRIEEITGGALTVCMWQDLRARIREFGICNAYLTAYMPTATTSNIIGQNECFEPFTSNIYTRKTLAGEFVVVNKHLILELQELNLWNDALCDEIIREGGSIQSCGNIPVDVRERYKTARELSQKSILNICRAMSPFVCQSMSMNLFLDEPSIRKILGFLNYGWKLGLKTGMYYCHTRPASGAQKNKSTGASAEIIAPPKVECLTCSV